LVLSRRRAQNLRRALDGRGEIKKSLGTRDSREALRVARPLAFAAKELFARLEASLSRPPTVDEALANAANARELKTTNTVDLGGGKSLSYSLETTSNDPAEFAAFHAEAARLQAKQDEQLARYQEKPIEVPVAMADYQRQQQEELARFKAELAAAAAARELAQPEGGVDEDLPAFKPSPDNVLSKRWAEYVSQSEGNHWSAERTTPAIVKKAARTRRKDKSNPAYTPAQLIELFQHECYQFSLAHHFWPPLIALFSGARRREAAWSDSVNVPAPAAPPPCQPRIECERVEPRGNRPTGLTAPAQLWASSYGHVGRLPLASKNYSQRPA
jgi:hypothetical protein